MSKRLALLLALVMVSACATSSGVTYRQDPPRYGLADRLNPNGPPLYIFFVHGMRATSSGGSDEFRKGLCKRLACSGPVAQDKGHITLAAPDFRYMNEPVWRSPHEWQQSRPLVKRYVYANGRQPVVVVEVNWWPLLHPFKCRFVVPRDAPLAGVSPAQLEVCSKQGRYAGSDEHHAWLTTAEAAEVRRTAAVTGGAARLNKSLKTEIFDWGLSDAVIAVGPMGEIIGRGIGGAFTWALATPLPPGSPAADGEASFALVSESLGSFVAFDYYARHYAERAPTLSAASDLATADAPRAAYGLSYVLDRSDQLYFLANQVPLLQLARLESPAAAASAGLRGTPPASGLELWARQPKGGSAGGLSENYGQIVAFSDPNDILTFELHPVGRAKIHNVFLSNGPTYFGLAADPGRAHTAHARNSCVLDIVFDKRTDGRCKVAGKGR